MGRCTRVNRIGETHKALNGMLMTIIAYRHAKDIDVQFDDGAVVEHVEYKHFQSGKIRHPNPDKQSRRGRPQNFCVGERREATCGIMMTIIAVRSYNDIDVQFDDGVKVLHKTYQSFKKGTIRHPDASTRVMRSRSQHIGETRKNTQGCYMTLIEWISCTDVTVKFDDGTIRQHCAYSAFKQGTLPNPNYINPRCHESRCNNQGIPMTIIRWNGINDIDIQYETGCILEHKAYAYFKQGRYQHHFPYTAGTIKLIKLAYKHGDTCNYYCKCIRCGIKDILTVEEIKNHICIGE